MRAAKDLFAPDALRRLQEEIADNSGLETFFTAIWDAGEVVSLEVLARGNDHAVPVLMDPPSDCNVIIHNHPNGDLTPSDADLGVAAQLINNGIAFFIVDNEGLMVNVVVEPGVILTTATVDPEESAAAFSPEGHLSSLFPGFEYRESQSRMAEMAQDVFNRGLHGVVEAPTGTGKSLAYLYPLARWARANRKRTLVCTHTIPLQQQLLDKDIPIVQAMLKLAVEDTDPAGENMPTVAGNGGTENADTEKADTGDSFSAVLIKGRNNYLCLRKLEEALLYEEDLFDTPGQEALAALSVWAGKTGEGSYQEIDFEIQQSVWYSVASDGDSCLGARCPNGADCFFRRSRRLAVEADLIVANHAIFLSDLVLRGERGKDSPVSVIPWCERVVIDEAHNLEDGATGHFGKSFAGNRLLHRLNRFYTKRRKPRGVLVMLRRALGAAKGAKRALGILEEDVIPAIETIRSRIPDISVRIESGCQRLLEGKRERSLQITPSLRHHPGFTEEVAPALQDLTELLAATARVFTRLYDEWLSFETGFRELTETHFLRIASGARRFDEDRIFLKGVLSDFDENTVYWAELPADGDSDRLSLSSAPIRVGALLQDLLYERFQGVLYTSATLTVGGKFDYYLSRTGLESAAERLSLLQLPAVFDYHNRSVFGVPDGFPDQKTEGFTSAFAEFASALIQSVGGRIFFLFTSWRQLGECYEATMETLPEGWRLHCLRQESGRSREQLLRDFVSVKGSVLFGVNSFWEGVDVKGDTLIGVVIVKLPFQVPSEPVIRARLDQIEAEGKSSFMEYSLPNAVIRFKQGVGRLLRSYDDYGFLCVLDSRVTGKQYGRLFLEAVPGRGAVRGSGPGVVDRLAGFIRGFEE